MLLRSHHLLATSALLASTATGFGQAVPASAPPSSPEDTIVLSPFVVGSERDTGYQATNTLAGTRLSTQIKDVGASVSVYTKDFLSDIGATNAQELLVFATGAEVGGVNGNFATNQPAAFSSSEGLRGNPQGAQRIRGLASADLSRGYFPTRIAFDDYNTSEVTLSRGPNAVLFGLGSPAGILNQGLIRPDYRNRGTFTHRLSSNTSDNLSHRASIDVNRSIIDRKLAVRVAGLYEDDRFKQKPAYERDRRVFASLLVEPFKSTALRASYESGGIRANRPSPFLAIDDISPWFEGGKYLYDWGAFDRNPALNAGAAPQTPTTRQGRQPNLFNTVAFFYDDPARDAISRAINLVIPTAQQPAGPGHPINQDGQREQYTFYGSSNLSRFTTGFRDQGFTPATASVFDWENRMFEGSTAYQREDFDALNIAFEQRALGDRVGIELAYDFQEFERVTYMPFGNRVGSEVFVDINTTLATGEANPNVGRPFIITGPVNQSTNLSEMEVVQATGFLRYDFADLNERWGPWLGRHTLTGLVSRSRDDSHNFIQKIVIDSPTGLVERLFGAQERPQQRQLNRIVYVGSSLLGAASASDVRLQSVDIPIFTPGNTYQARLWDNVAQQFVDTTVLSRLNLNGGTLSRDEVESSAVVLQSHWLKDHLVTIVGWRDDEATRWASNPPALPASADPNQPFVFDGWLLPEAPNQVVSGDVVTYSIVAKVPASMAKAIPGVDELSFFYNDAENFEAGAGRIDNVGRTLAPPTGVTEEYGVNLTLLDNKLSLRWSRFETAAAFVTGSNVINNEMNHFFNLVGSWEIAPINSPDTVVVTAADRARLIQGLESTVATMKELFNYSVSTNAQGVATFSFRNPTGLSDTTDFVAKGWELEAVYNPTRSWRIFLNVAKQETLQANVAPVASSWANGIRGNYDALSGKPLTGVSGQTVGQAFPGLLYGPLQQVLAQTGTQAFDQRKWRVNLVTNYAFGSDGPLAGWNVGGALRWQDESILGYPTVTEDGVTRPDLANAVTAPSTTNADVWVGYKRRNIWRGVDWRVQLNVRNVIGDDDFIPTSVQPDGSIASYRIPGYRTWMLTNTFDF